MDWDISQHSQLLTINQTCVYADIGGKYWMLKSGLKSDKQVHVNGYWVAMYKSYNATWIMKVPIGTFAEGKIWCVWIIPDQYIEFSGNMAPNYAPVWPHTHLFSHLFVFFSFQALLPSHSSSVRRFGQHTGQLYKYNTNQWVHTLTHRHTANKVRASRPLTQTTRAPQVDQ